MKFKIKMNDRLMGSSEEEVEVKNDEELASLVQKTKKRARMFPVPTTVVLCCFEKGYFNQIL